MMVSVLSSLHGSTGIITLNRPEAINALSPEMIVLLRDQLRAWRSDDAVSAVVIDGAGERGLCAGGDIKVLHAQSDIQAADFWAHEYLMNADIAEYPKPYIALMDGITMGGGVGVSAHGSYRIVTDRSRIAMPEVRIGLSPDVGGSYLLAKAPGELGTHFALTGDTMSGADAIACGFADAYLPSSRLPDLRDALTTGGDAVTIVRSMVIDPPASAIEAQREWIDRCYSAPTAELILERLDAESSPLAASAAQAIRSACPFAVKVTLEAVRRVRTGMTLRDALEQELRIVAGMYLRDDLREGIRAQVIDKDRRPSWQPATLAEVSDPSVAAVLATPLARSLQHD
jgi:enoyl-CoA hydratase